MKFLFTIFLYIYINNYMIIKKKKKKKKKQITKISTTEIASYRKPTFCM